VHHVPIDYDPMTPPVWGYRSGLLPNPEAGFQGTYLTGSLGQWSLTNPASQSNYADAQGLPAENQGPPDWITGGTINSDAGSVGYGPSDPQGDAEFYFPGSPVPTTAGGAPEFSVSPNDLTLQWFHMPDDPVPHS
jgi:hypothetical protein